MTKKEKLLRCVLGAFVSLLLAALILLAALYPSRTLIGGWVYRRGESRLELAGEGIRSVRGLKRLEDPQYLDLRDNPLRAEELLELLLCILLLLRCGQNPREQPLPPPPAVEEPEPAPRPVDLLIAEHKKHPDNPYMFPSPKTGGMYYPDSVVKLHQKALKRAGLPHIRFHDLRHPYVKHTTKIYFCKSRNPKPPNTTDGLGFLFLLSYIPVNWHQILVI